MEKVEVKILIDKGCQSFKMEIEKDNRHVFWEDLTAQEKEKLRKAFAYLNEYISEHGEPSIQLR